jgi:hypothetical protein
VACFLPELQRPREEAHRSTHVSERDNTRALEEEVGNNVLQRVEVEGAVLDREYAVTMEEDPCSDVAPLRERSCSSWPPRAGLSSW